MKWKKYLFTVISVAHDRTSSLVSDTQDDAQDSSWGGHGFHLQGAGERRARVLVQLERARDAHAAPGAFHFAARLPWAPAAQTAGGQSRPAAPPCCASRAEQSNSNGVAHHRHRTHHTPPRSLCSADCCCLRLQIPPLRVENGTGKSRPDRHRIP